MPLAAVAIGRAEDRMSWPEEHLDEALARPFASGLIKRIASADILWDQLSQSFPCPGTYIDWSGTEAHVGTRGDHAAFCRFFALRVLELGGEAPAYYLNDHLGLEMRATLAVFAAHLRPIIELPLHHYFVSSDFDWCIAYRMEGDIDFGRSPRPPFAAPGALRRT